MTASSTAASARTCPACGARNSSLSLFCAECGASLNGGDETTTTSSYSPFAPDADSQATAAFTPTPTTVDGSDDTRVSRPVTSTVQPFTPSWEKDEPAAPSANDAWSSEVIAYPVTQTGTSGGMRGFFLGLLAVLLILLVLGAWLWAGVLDFSTRDSISSFFSFLDFRN